jgi:hypothetical protein
MRLILAIAMAVAFSVGVPVSGNAAVITGTLNTTGSARVTATTIDFLPLAGGAGNFNIPVDDEGTGDFVGLSVGEIDGSILDLTLPADPVGVVFSKPNFMTFTAFPGLSFELTFIAPGVNGACDANNCTPPGSPFNLQNVATGSTASFGVSGKVTDGSGDPASVFTGTFTTQFDDLSYQEVLAMFEAQGFIQSSYSAQFTVRPSGSVPEIPEPATMFLFGAGILGLGLIKRRSAKA